MLIIWSVAIQSTYSSCKTDGNQKDVLFPKEMLIEEERCGYLGICRVIIPGVPEAVISGLFFCSLATLLSFGILGDDVSTGEVDRSWFVIRFLSPGLEPLLRNSNNWSSFFF